jgi:hypothetical protein
LRNTGCNPPPPPPPGTHTHTHTHTSTQHAHLHAPVSSTQAFQAAVRASRVAAVITSYLTECVSCGRSRRWFDTVTFSCAQWWVCGHIRARESGRVSSLRASVCCAHAVCVTTRWVCACVHGCAVPASGSHATAAQHLQRQRCRAAHTSPHTAHLAREADVLHLAIRTEHSVHCWLLRKRAQLPLVHHRHSSHLLDAGISHHQPPAAACRRAGERSGSSAACRVPVVLLPRRRAANCSAQRG